MRDPQRPPTIELVIPGGFIMAIAQHVLPLMVRNEAGARKDPPQVLSFRRYGDWVECSGFNHPVQARICAKLPAYTDLFVGPAQEFNLPGKDLAELAREVYRTHAKDVRFVLMSQFEHFVLVNGNPFETLSYWKNAFESDKANTLDYDGACYADRQGLLRAVRLTGSSDAMRVIDFGYNAFAPRHRVYGEMPFANEGGVAFDACVVGQPVTFSVKSRRFSTILDCLPGPVVEIRWRASGTYPNYLHFTTPSLPRFEILDNIT